jgi:predicted HAD superfamily Cof-like phosphohydrolase
MDYLKSVEEFHETFEHPINDEKVNDEKLKKLRVKLIFEELDELSTAMGSSEMMKELCETYLKNYSESKEYDKVETLDAFCDLQYVLSGAIISLGYKDVFNEAFDDVHKSNMTKMCETKEIAEKTVEYYKKEKGEKLRIDIVPKNDGYILKREDDKVLKSISYSPVKLDKYI